MHITHKLVLFAIPSIIFCTGCCDRSVSKTAFDERDISVVIFEIKISAYDYAIKNNLIERESSEVVFIDEESRFYREALPRLRSLDVMIYPESASVLNEQRKFQNKITDQIGVVIKIHEIKLDLNLQKASLKLEWESSPFVSGQYDLWLERKDSGVWQVTDQSLDWIT